MTSEKACVLCVFRVCVVQEWEGVAGRERVAGRHGVAGRGRCCGQRKGLRKQGGGCRKGRVGEGCWDTEEVVVVGGGRVAGGEGFRDNWQSFRTFLMWRGRRCVLLGEGGC